MIRRTMNATFLNEVANHPSVRPFLGGPENPVLDLAPLAANPGVIFLEVPDDGGWVWQPILPTVYEVHTLFLPHARGKAFFANVREALRYMFVETDCLEVVTKCPDDNGGARMVTSTLGFRERFRRAEAWAPGVGISYRVFSIDDWFVRDAECLAAGQGFHEMILGAKIAAGSALPVHADDEAHDRAAGAAALIAQAGNLPKAVAFYNRWAIFAGYATINQLSPTLIDIQDAVIEVKGGKMEVLKCRSGPQSSEERA